jgi:hypothetical protein
MNAMISRKTKKWKYINLNPAMPNIRGLIKIHTHEVPIRPVVNWKTAVAYKLANYYQKYFKHISLCRTLSTSRILSSLSMISPIFV